MKRTVLLLIVICLSTAAAGRGVAADSSAANLLAGSMPEFCAAEQTKPVWHKTLSFVTGGHASVRGRWTFRVSDTDHWAGLTLRTTVSIESCRLNGKSVPLPLKGMRYATLPGISPKLLAPVQNTLEIEWTISGKKGKKSASAPSKPAVSLVPLTAEQLDFQTAPVLGAAGGDYFTVACRTNLLAEATLEIDGKQWQSPAGLMHSFRADGLKPSTVQNYTLTARVPGTTATKKIGPLRTSTLPASASAGPLRFVALGDSRSFPKDWAAVASAVLRQKPDFVVFSGDMVTDGREDRLWDDEYFGMVPTYFATIPSFYILGNHEGNSPLVGRLLAAPALDHWKQTAGPALLIGIDGALKWNEGSENYKWLEDVLKSSRDKFVFLFSHYPPWTSGRHGASPDHGMIEGRRYLMPLLKKYGATAMIAGHDHCFERSEPPDGVTVITSGGAGAPLYAKVTNAQQQNPHSAVFAMKHHYCLFTMEGDQCVMKALTPDGEELDTKRWAARAPR